MSSFGEHYRQGEDALSILDAEKEPAAWEEAIRSGEVALAVQAAQAHALLAIARAMTDVSGTLQEIRDELAGGAR